MDQFKKCNKYPLHDLSKHSLLDFVYFTQKYKFENIDEWIFDAFLVLFINLFINIVWGFSRKFEIKWEFNIKVLMKFLEKL